MSFMDEAMPTLSDTLVPPIVRGTADLTTFAYQGNAVRGVAGPHREQTSTEARNVRPRHRRLNWRFAARRA